MEDVLKTSKYVVAFIDVLGASKMIEKDVDRSLNIIHGVYLKALKAYETVFQKSVHLDISIFSDNIVIGCKVLKEEEGLITLCFRLINYFAAIIQGSFLFEGLLVRGGIAYGSFFKDDIMIWGDALIKAYELENSVAIYPRIVVDPDLVGKMKLHQKEDVLSSLWLKQDNDGLLYIDYLQNKYITNYEFVLLDELRAYDQRVIECKNNTKIMQKNIWQLNYIKSKLLGGKNDASDEG